MANNEASSMELEVDTDTIPSKDSFVSSNSVEMTNKPPDNDVCESIQDNSDSRIENIESMDIDITDGALSKPTVNCVNKSPKIECLNSSSNNNGANVSSNKCYDDINVNNNLLDLEVIQKKAASLANFVMMTMLEKRAKSTDKVDETLLRCVKIMMNKHSIYFNSLMKRIDFRIESGIHCFKTIADEIFEGKRKIINWGRVIAYYCFAGQFAIYCKKNKLENYAIELSSFVGKYASEQLSHFVMKEGGWVSDLNSFL